MPDFSSWLSENRAPTDYFWALVSAVIYAGNLLINRAAEFSRAEAEGGPPPEPYHAWHFALSGVSLLVAAIISLARPTYLRHRTAILVAAKLACFLSLGTALQPHVALLPRVMQLDGPPPSTALLRFALILEQTLLLVVGALGWELPVGTHLWVQAVGLLRMLSLLPVLCATQCAQPGYASMYGGLAGWLGSACGAVFPVTVAARRDGPPPSPCLAVHAFALLAAGYVLPALLLHYSQSRMRARFLAESGQARGGLPSSEPWLAAWLHAGMSAVALPVVWRLVEVGAPLALNATRAAGLGGPRLEGCTPVGGGGGGA